MPLDEIWQLRHIGTLKGELVENVYFYRQDSGSGNASELAEAFQEVVTPLLQGIQCDNMVWHTIRVINLGDLTDFAIGTTNDAGGSSGNMLPPDDAINFTLRVNTRAVRPGSKRYSAIPSEYAPDGTITGSTYITNLNALADGLREPLSKAVDPAASFQQVVVKRVPYVTPAGRDAYRLPESDAELVYADVVGVLVDMEVSHQDTRSNGR